jgi:hypothetical protein
VEDRGPLEAPERLRQVIGAVPWVVRVDSGPGSSAKSNLVKGPAEEWIEGRREVQREGKLGELPQGRRNTHLVLEVVAELEGHFLQVAGSAGARSVRQGEPGERVDAGRILYSHPSSQLAGAVGFQGAGCTILLEENKVVADDRYHTPIGDEAQKVVSGEGGLGRATTSRGALGSRARGHLAFSLPRI